MRRTLTAIPFDGLNTDCLGNYLAALGVISAVSKRWQSVRACWKASRLVLLTDDPTVDDAAIKAYLLNDWKPTSYERWWKPTQTADRKAKTSTGIWRERSERALADVRLLDAHVVGTGRNRFNPVLGTGGNVGRREFAKACKDAIRLLAKPEKPLWLDATLTGQIATALPDLNNGGTWFVYANKTFNSGQDWSREGQLSPWSLLLATEGAFLLVGGVNRRLGSRARPYAVFPFVSEPSQPETDGEIGMARAEFWAPLWQHPATITELHALFQRGLAKLGGRPAQAPHEFAVAALDAGVDSGVSEFARFELRQTTSSQVYEAIPRERIRVRSTTKLSDDDNATTPISRLLLPLIESGWMDRLPFEPRDSKQKGKFVGLRGPIEAAILQISERPDDADRWQQLLLRLAAAQARIDRNKALRERCVAIPPLSTAWFEHVWPAPCPEVEIARAIASVGWYAGRTPIPLLANVFGVSVTFRQDIFRTSLPKTRTAQAVWGPGDPLQNLLNLAQRRLTDAEDLPKDAKGLSSTPFAGTCVCSANLIQQFLASNALVDLDQIARWIPPLSLINWSRWSRIASTVPDLESNQPRYVADGTGMLHALIRPLFHCDPKRNVYLDDGTPLFQPEQMPKPNLLRRLFNLLRFGELDEAVKVLRDRYLAVGRSIVMPPEGLVADRERIAAALLIPMSDSDVRCGVRRWLQPARNQ